MKNISTVMYLLVVLGAPATWYGKKMMDSEKRILEPTCFTPGLHITVEAVTVSTDGIVEVALLYTDDDGQMIDRNGVMTHGAVSTSLILAEYNGETRDYHALTNRIASSTITGAEVEQASTDGNGMWADHGLGRATFTFSVPVNNMSATHSIALYARRSQADLAGEDAIENVVHDFRPDGAEVTETWDAVSDNTCNSCHTQLALHGGQRRDVKLCATCHNPFTSDPDTLNTVDLGVMVHKIHSGASLPSVQAGTPYQIIGFRNSVHDYSDVVVPRDLRDCATCHRDDVSGGDVWATQPSSQACGSCHDDVNFVTGENHRAGPAEDSQCANCHVPMGELEFDLSVAGAHTIPTQSHQLPGLNVDILEVTNSGPGENMQVRFKISENDGTSVDPSTLDRMRFQVAGPNTDYAEVFSQDGGAADFDGDTATLTFETPLPSHAAGSWSISADVYRNLTIADARGNDISVREVAFNPLFDFPVTDATAHSRRQIVDQNLCLNCHGDLALHGGQRRAVQECVMCHNPSGTDHEVRPEDAGEPESIQFAHLIHKIHKGEELEYDFTVYGFRSSVHNYNHVRYPADLNNCEQCHLPGTYTLPLSDDASESIQPSGWYTPVGPGSTACLSCHESRDAAAHAFVNTAFFGESCGTCHGEGREYAVSKVHGH